jgi:outer membrane protein OmpA-like peptidoglycan-associated protein
MKLAMLLWIAFLTLLSGCAATMHSDYQPVFYKQNIPKETLEIIARRFREQGLKDAAISIDALGRVQLAGRYKDEREVEKAFSLARSIVGDVAVSGVRPSTIDQKDWEISARDGFKGFVEALAKKYQMSIRIEEVGPERQVSISVAGIDGIVQFESNSSEPTERAEQFYRQMAIELVRTSSNGLNSKRILIVGHTDDVGDSASNSVLSERRALAIGKLYAAAGFDPKQIYYQGAGETLPVADNATEKGRGLNRRVEVTDLSDEAKFHAYLESRRPNTDFYRPVDKPIAKEPSKSVAEIRKPAIEPRSSSEAGKTASLPNRSATQGAGPRTTNVYQGLNFGGIPATDANSSISIGEIVTSNSTSWFPFLSNAHAADLGPVRRCSSDRPRVSGDVKNLVNGSPMGEISKQKFLPQLYGRSWDQMVGGHMIVLNSVYVMRESGTTPNTTTLRVYSNYKPTANAADEKPAAVNMAAKVNTYAGKKGILYRVFASGAQGVNCIDVLFAGDMRTTALSGKVLYGPVGSELVADFVPALR